MIRQDSRAEPPASCWHTSLLKWTDWLFAKRSSPAHWLVAALILAGLFALQWKLGSGFITQGNQDLQSSDQNAYLALAKENAGRWWPAKTDGGRNPLVPWLLQPWLTDDSAETFASAKRANVGFGVVASILLAVFFLRRLPFLPALSLAMLSAFCVILPVSTFVGAEVIFYTAYFFFWVACWRLLMANRLRDYAIAGLLGSVAYLAKPSLLLTALVFIPLILFRWWSVRRTTHSTDWNAGKMLLGSILFSSVFLVPVLPRALDARAKFGSSFQNTATSCFWYENWEQVLPHLAKLSPKRIAEIPEAERPSMSKYWQKHTLPEMFARLNSGMLVQFQNFFLPEKTLKKRKETPPPKPLRLTIARRGAYPLALLLLGTALAAGAQRGKGSDTEGTPRRTLIGFTLGCFVLHFLAFSFYTPLASGARFIMGMFIPVLFALGIITESLRARCPQVWPQLVYRATYTLLALSLLWQLFPLIRVTAFGEVRGAF